MKRFAYLAGFVVLAAVAAAPAFGAVASSISGTVSDSAGVPQIGAQVQLLRSDLSVVASVYTDSQGKFLIAALLPGKYALKATGASFLPALRENVRVHGGTVVNLTLNTLYEVMQWLPADPRSGNEQKDDWAWTLRSAANRPLLRWLEDGPLLVVSDGSGAAPKLKARLMATGEAGSFGESGERISAAVEDTPASSRELLARVDFSPGSNEGRESMLGFRQDLGFAGSVESVAAVSIEPEIEGAGNQGLEIATVRSEEDMHFGPSLEAEVGTNEVVSRLTGPASNTITAALPFATMQWGSGESRIHYRMATMIQNQAGALNETAAGLPVLAENNGNLAIERGLHQEIGWERNTDASGMAILFYSDHIEDPVLQALCRFSAGDASAANVLFDPASGLMRTTGPGFSTAGVQASLQRRLPGGNQVRLSYRSGDALVMAGAPKPATLAQVLAVARPHRAQTYAISLSGTVDGTGTEWRASYSWQSDDTVTEVAPFAQDTTTPFFNLHLAQPIHIMRDGPAGHNSTGLEALVDVRNLLAEGYRPYILSDGSLLLFAQDPRSVRAGLAFTF
jgi:Carboxypeptidase regulatory-like domain